MAKEYFYQSERVLIPAGTTPKTMFSEFVLNSSYERCVGLAILESQDGGIPFYRIGVNDKDQQYVQSVHKTLLQSSPAAGLRVTERFLPVNIKAGGHKVKISTELTKAPQSDIEYDVTFLLERDEQR